MVRKRQKRNGTKAANTNKRRKTAPQTPNLFKHHQPGFFQSVECSNFMCHKNLKIVLGPGITFITGQNGHGKSAIVVALIQVFSTDRRLKKERGRASDLRRNLEDGDKATSAKVVVRIHNAQAASELDSDLRFNSGPFHPQVYGKVIIVELEIFEKSRMLRVLNEKRELIVEGREAIARRRTPRSVETQSISKQLTYSKSDLDDIERQIGDLDDEINDLQLHSGTSERVRLDGEIEMFRSTISESQSEIGTFTEQLVNSKQLVNETLQSKIEADAKKTQIQTEIRSLCNPARSSPVTEAQRCLQKLRRKFANMPLGPISDFVTISSFAPLVKMLNAYVVQSVKDERALREVYPGAKQLNVYCMKPDNIEIKTPRGACRTILDYLGFSDKLVWQAVVEWASVETCALAGSIPDARGELCKKKTRIKTVIIPDQSSLFVTLVSSHGMQLQNAHAGSGVIGRGKTPHNSAERVNQLESSLQKANRELRQCYQIHRKYVRDISAGEKQLENLKIRQYQLQKSLESSLVQRANVPDSDEADEQVERLLSERENFERQLRDAQAAMEEASSNLSETEKSLADCVAREDDLKSRKVAMEEDLAEQKLQRDTVKGLAFGLEEKLRAARQEQDRRALDEKNLQEELVQLGDVPEVPFDDGVDFSEAEEYICAKIRKLNTKLAAAKRVQPRGYQQVFTELQEAEEQLQTSLEHREELEVEIEKLTAMTNERTNIRSQALGFGMAQVRYHFDKLLATKAVSADLNIDMNARKLEIVNYRVSSEIEDTGSRHVSTASGGEHSFLQSVLLSALWKMVDTPFICLDEYEVFVDDATRVTSQKNLIEALSSLSQQAQAVLISPTVANTTDTDDPRFVYVEVKDPALVGQ
ncbi:Structural maintenance of chromosomes protein 6 [Yarrowia sp. B02]|nr:Structural maintenance of chromosomes protein 6 [Yarrowia sp. B02]